MGCTKYWTNFFEKVLHIELRKTYIWIIFHRTDLTYVSIFTGSVFWTKLTDHSWWQLAYYHSMHFFQCRWVRPKNTELVTGFGLIGFWELFLSLNRSGKNILVSITTVWVFTRYVIKGGLKQGLKMSTQKISQYIFSCKLSVSFFLSIFIYIKTRWV